MDLIFLQGFSPGLYARSVHDGRVPCLQAENMKITKCQKQLNMWIAIHAHSLLAKLVWKRWYCRQYASHQIYWVVEWTPAPEQVILFLPNVRPYLYRQAERSRSLGQLIGSYFRGRNEKISFILKCHLRSFQSIKMVSQLIPNEII